MTTTTNILRALNHSYSCKTKEMRWTEGLHHNTRLIVSHTTKPQLNPFVHIRPSLFPIVRQRLTIVNHVFETCLSLFFVRHLSFSSHRPLSTHKPPKSEHEANDLKKRIPISVTETNIKRRYQPAQLQQPPKMLSSHLLPFLPLLSLCAGSPISSSHHHRRATNQVFTASIANNPSDITSGSPGLDAYSFFSGDGSSSSGWPSMSSWVSFQSLFDANKAVMKASCLSLEPNAAPTSDAELGQIWNAIQSASWRSGVDQRFILAVLLQESKGCVRVHTTANAVPNPGLMQDHAGVFSCNDRDTGAVLDPCPDWAIFGMIDEGVSGTAAGDGLAGVLNRVGGSAGDAATYYTAARVYNSGSYTPGDLGDGRGSTTCYASDVANRLVGWVYAPSTCGQ